MSDKIKDDADVIKELVNNAEMISILSDILRDAIAEDCSVQNPQWYDRTTSILCGIASTHRDMIAEFAKAQRGEINV